MFCKHLKWISINQFRSIFHAMWRTKLTNVTNHKSACHGIWCSHLFSGLNMNKVLVLMMGFFFREGRLRLPNRPPVFRIFMKFLRLTGWSSSSRKRQTTTHNCTFCCQVFSPLKNMKKEAPNGSFTDSNAPLQHTYTCCDATKNALRYIPQHSVT